MTMQSTPRFGFPYPDQTEGDNPPLHFQLLATAVDTVLGAIQDSIIFPQIICGEFDFTGSEGLKTVDVGVPLQFVEFVTQVTSPTASSGAVGTYCRGILGYASDGTVYQYNTGIRALASGTFMERRTVSGKCAGLMVDDTTINNNCTGAFTDTGFTLNIASGTGTNNQTAFYVAHQGPALP